MFSGIIQSQGKIKKLSREEKSLVVEIHSSLNGYKLGSSICCSGICLTVTSKNKNTFKADISYETMNKTNAKYWKVGKKINLEKSLKVGDEISGHFVFGHIDTTCSVEELYKVGSSWFLSFKFPKNLKKFIVQKGSISLNGISLTINEVKSNKCHCMIIPHTYKYTDIHTYQKNEILNLEVDMLARYAHSSKS
jgi:riboflavin synthase